MEIMNNDDRKFSDHSSEPRGGHVNLSENQDANRKTKNSRALLILFSLVLVVILLIGITYMGLSRPKSVTQTPTIRTVERQSPPVTTVLDIPPLYPGLKWKYTEKKVKDGSYTLKGGTLELEMYRADSEMLTRYPSDFINYYKHELEMDRWTLTANTQGGINGHDYFAYEKGGNYINFGVFTARNPGSNRILGYFAFVEHN